MALVGTSITHSRFLNNVPSTGTNAEVDAYLAYVVRSLPAGRVLRLCLVASRPLSAGRGLAFGDSHALTVGSRSVVDAVVNSSKPYGGFKWCWKVDEVTWNAQLLYEAGFTRLVRAALGHRALGVSSGNKITSPLNRSPFMATSHIG